MEVFICYYIFYHVERKMKSTSPFINIVTTIYKFIFIVILQNSDDNSVNESLTVPEPSSMRFSETDHLTSPEAVSDSNKDSVNNTDTPKPEEKKKLVSFVISL